MRLLLSLFLGLAHVAKAEKISGCDEVKVQGYCTAEVKVAKDTCKEKDKGEDIAKSFAEIKASKLGTGTNLKKLSQKYDDLNKSSKSEAQNKKACVQVAKAAKKDCEARCESPTGGRGGGGNIQAQCDKSLESIEQIIDYCKKNAEAAEEMAEMAAIDAGLYAGAPPPGGSSSSYSSSSYSSDPNVGAPPPADQVIGYADPGTGGSADPDGVGEATRKAITNGLKGGSGSGSGATSGSTSGGLGGEDSSSELDDFGKGGSGSGSGMGDGGSGNASGGGKGGSSDTTITPGKSDGAPGYMIWGVPARKKKAPLTLLPQPVKVKTKTASEASASAASSNKEPETVDKKTTTPALK